MNRVSSGGGRHFISDMHPAVKLVVFLAVIHSAASSATISAHTFFTILFLAATYVSGVSFSLLGTKLKPFLLILVTTFLINLAFGSGLELSAGLTYRFLLIILFSVLLTVTTEPRVLATVILSPFRGKHAENLRTVFMVALEFIPFFVGEVKATAAKIKDMPEYKGKAYKAIFRPELYLKPLMEGLAAKSEHAAEDLRNGGYSAAALGKPSAAETVLAVAAVSLAVAYAV